MQDLPHHYDLDVRAKPEGDVELASAGLATLASAPPAEFGGPGDRWSPETLLLAAVADCFALTFRASAAASKLSWSDLRCRAQGTLDRAEGGLRFTAIALHATLTLPPGQRLDRAERLLQRAEKTCLVSNSLSTPVHLKTEIVESAS